MKRAILGSASALVLTLAACGNGGHSAPKPSPSSSPKPDPQVVAVKPNWTTKLDVIGQPVVTGHTAVVVVRVKGGHLRIVGVDISTGKVRWRHPYSPGNGAQGEAIEPEVLRSKNGTKYVVFAEPSNPKWDYFYSPMVALDAATGAVMRRRGDIVPNDVIGSCPDGRDMCTVGPWTDQKTHHGWGEDRAYRWSLDTGKVTPLAGVPSKVRGIGSGLWSTNERPGERLVFARRGQHWSQSVASIFGSLYSSDQGWSFTTDDRAGMVVGAVGRAFPQRMYDRFKAGKPVTYPIGYGNVVVGLDVKIGKRRWIDRGAAIWCLDTAEASGSSKGPGVTMVCRTTGRRTEQKGKKPKTTGYGLTLAGLDDRTGSTVWSVGVTASSARLLERRDITPLAPDGLVARTTDGPHWIRLDKGDAGLVRDDRGLFCSKSVGVIKAKGAVTHRGGRLYYRCNPSGKKASAPISVWGLRAIRAHAGWRVVAERGRLVGYRM